MRNNEKTIKRFSGYVRIAHWTNALCVLMLFISGLPLYAETFRWLYNIFGGAENAQIVHRVFGVIFLMPTIFMLIFDRKSFIEWTKNVTSWNSYDIQFLKAFPKEFFGRKVEIPPQGFFNGGQKVNSLLTIFSSIILVVSGFLIWFRADFPKELVLWAYPLHDLGVGLLISVVIGHIFLSVVKKQSRPSFMGMIKGEVSTKYAEEHHQLWYDEEVKKDK